jgi:hypothetical protein
MPLRTTKSALPLTIGGLVGVFALAVAPVAMSQNTPNDKPPVLDVHVHAMDESFPTGPMCPNTSKFIASDPATKEAPWGWVQEQCTPKLYPSAKGEYIKDVVAEMERLNVTAVVFGDPKGVQKWKDAAPNRVIPGTSFTAGGIQPGGRVAIDELRKDFTDGGFKVMGEIGLQYEGISPSDPSVDQYFALAEELDVPVAIHMGTGGSGRANVTTPKFRGSMGDPLLLEGLLAKHPKLRVQVMHAGYPMIDNMLTLLQANSHVYVDQLIWPGLMAYSISVIQNADYLTAEQKRDILYNNAARFLRLDTATATADAAKGVAAADTTTNKPK